MVIIAFLEVHLTHFYTAKRVTIAPQHCYFKSSTQRPRTRGRKKMEIWWICPIKLSNLTIALRLHESLLLGFLISSKIEILSSVTLMTHHYRTIVIYVFQCVNNNGLSIRISINWNSYKTKMYKYLLKRGISVDGKYWKYSSPNNGAFVRSLAKRLIKIIDYVTINL